MKLLTKVPSAWMIYISATSNKPGEWLNLAAVDRIIVSDDKKALQVIFSSGKIQNYSGDRAYELIAELKKCS